MTTYEVASMAGLPYSTLARWAQDNIIRPKNYSGKRLVAMEWSGKNAYEVCILARLRGFFSLQELRKAMEWLRQRGHNPLSKGRFLVVGGDAGKQRLIKLCLDRAEAIEVIGQNRGQLLLLPLVDPEPMDGEVNT